MKTLREKYKNDLVVLAALAAIEAARRLATDEWVEGAGAVFDHKDYTYSTGPAYLGDGEALEALRAALKRFEEVAG